MGFNSGFKGLMFLIEDGTCVGSSCVTGRLDDFFILWQKEAESEQCGEV